MVRLIIFAVLSTGLVFQSWKSFHQRWSHGFFRFFAFECILGLILLNINYWFYKPFSAIQIVSWLLLISSIILAVQGFYLLHEVGKPKYGIEDTTVLVSKGIYKYIRHPLYSSLLFLGWGVFLKDISLISVTIVLVASVFLIAIAKVEEKENLEKFGADYSAYMRMTKMFIPFII